MKQKKVKTTKANKNNNNKNLKNSKIVDRNQLYITYALSDIMIMTLNFTLTCPMILHAE